MSEKDYAPLSTACVRALHDKIYERRKAAALEIEKMVKEFAAVNNTGQIKKLVKVLGQDFATSQNAHARKGGLIGLAAVAIALGKDADKYTEELIKPTLACFSDTDLRVRYYACEGLYNVVKVIRGSVLPHFGSIFKALSKIATDPEQNVKSASELLDRLMKEIVTECDNFDLDGFIPFLRERLYTKSSFSRQFVISWLSVLAAVPEIDLLAHLPELLDGLFGFLSDPMAEVKKMCDTVLGEFLRGIKADPVRVDFGSMINILISHAHEKNDDVVQFTAITWIKEFVQLSGPTMLPYMSGIFTAVLPCLAYDTDARRNIKETATAVNFTLKKLIALKDKAHGEHDDRLAQLDINDLNIEQVVEVLTQHLLHNSVQTKVAVLGWIHHLYTNLPNQMNVYIDKLFPALQRTLSDQADEVVQQCLVVIAEVISTPKNSSKTMNAYYYRFMVDLLNLFSKDKSLLDERGSFIIRQLCVLLNAEDIYKALAEILYDEANLSFASMMVQQLNLILLTSSELFDLRTKLKDLNTRENCRLFNILYETWCHNPVATVALCLLTQNYIAACNLIKLFGDLEITVSFLTEIDKLVQLIESPIFAYLRLELLQVPCDPNLVKALYGLLMILPQTDAFHTLRTRLSCIPSAHLLYDDKSINKQKDEQSTKKEMNSDRLLEHFVTVQAKHKEYKTMIRAKELSTLEKDINNVDT